LPPIITQKRRTPIEPISYDELMSNAGMSGFVSFLIPPLEPSREAAAAEPLRPPRKGRVRKALTVEDGHSLAEQAVYEALWKVALPVVQRNSGEALSEDRTARIGYHRLAQMTRLSWVSVKANLRSLEKKLAIEVTGSENSATREGKCYRVYSRQAILERRERYGLVLVRRSRGVELLKREGPSAGTPRA
jgi:hypothetical protein